MTSKDFIEAEAGNNGSIILYREGLFWKAYEKSAYAVCTQIKPLKAIKRRLKSLGGGEDSFSGDFHVSMNKVYRFFGAYGDYA